MGVGSLDVHGSGARAALLLAMGSGGTAVTAVLAYRTLGRTPLLSGMRLLA